MPELYRMVAASEGGSDTRRDLGGPEDARARGSASVADALPVLRSDAA